MRIISHSLLALFAVIGLSVPAAAQLSSTYTVPPNNLQVSPQDRSAQIQLQNEPYTLNRLKKLAKVHFIVDTNDKLGFDNIEL